MSMEMQPMGNATPPNKGAFVDENGFLVQYTVQKYTADGINCPLPLNPAAEKLIKEKIPMVLSEFESNQEIDKKNAFKVDIKINPVDEATFVATADQGKKHLEMTSKLDSEEQGYNRSGMLVGMYLRDLATECAKMSTEESELFQRVAILKNLSDSQLEEATPKKSLGLKKEISIPDLRALFLKVEMGQAITKEEQSSINSIFATCKRANPAIDYFGPSDSPQVSFSIREIHIASLDPTAAQNAYEELKSGPRDALDDFMKVLREQNPDIYNRLQKLKGYQPPSSSSSSSSTS